MDFSEFLANVQWPQVAIGAACCLLGWTLYWIGVHAVGAALGGAVGFVAGMVIAQAAEWHDKTAAIAFACALVCAIVGAILMRKVHWGAFLVIGGIAGVAGAWVFLPTVAETELFRVYPGVARLGYYALSALVVGVLVATLSRYVVVIATSFIGASYLVMGTQPPYAPLVCSVLFGVSLLIQSGLASRFVNEDAVRHHRPDHDWAPDD